jgi:hypothetical protein
VRDRPRPSEATAGRPERGPHAGAWKDAAPPDGERVAAGIDRELGKVAAADELRPAEAAGA